jgi:hypothetical protein
MPGAARPLRWLERLAGRSNRGIQFRRSQGLNSPGNAKAWPLAFALWNQLLTRLFGDRLEK